MVTELIATEVPSLLALRRDPRLLKLPPYISALCILVGIAWLFVLPLREYHRRTYISESALLPGQVHTYFGGSEQSVFNAYKHEVRFLADKTQEETSKRLTEIFKSNDLKVATQKYEYHAAGNRYAGENLYAVLHAPRGDATEAIVLVAGWRNMDGELNQSGVALVMTLARYFKRWSLWSKDIIFLITPDSKAGPQAWVDAYHDSHDSTHVQSLTLKSGALQGAVVVDNPLNQRFETLHIVYDGINGQLPNLDLFNTAVEIATGQMRIKTALQKIFKPEDSYKARLETMLRGMANQGLGHGTGPHSSFIPYHVDAVTLQAIGLGWEDEMAMGRVIESMFRSLNNLLEHLHQSFFFYLLMHTERFVSIGTYLPSAMLIAVNFTIKAIALWLQSGRPPKTKLFGSGGDTQGSTEKVETEIIEDNGSIAIVPKADLVIAERNLLLPLGIMFSIYALGFIPLYIFNNLPQSRLAQGFYILLAINPLFPLIIARLLQGSYINLDNQQLILIKCFSLLLHGMCLATLATLNFSLSFLIGLVSCPLAFIGLPPSMDESSIEMKATKGGVSPTSLPAKRKGSWLGYMGDVFVFVILQAVAPTAVFLAVCSAAGVKVEMVLTEAAFGWHVWGLWTQVVVWCVWWPAWLIGASFACMKIM
ncbi:Glycosyl phosphatidyl inositol protein transamidase complex subunit [Agyrium rufum]|nr:Glycosyl phosphatidyl inositol protein transamidase complex subunit [Agyrium rufum]